ncbi:7442_t:CDS:1 [Paraglomus occultum]|uniref:7442_t:CDS:1 n=1 Tax=Paraglomus occultum TaxID=144539 RepID=A0A9N9G6H4_9GLOM|nr:7442_t:CDS:1 [Paraglomus occultum]
MSSLVSDTPSFNNQALIDPTAINTPITLTPFEISLLIWSPYLLTVDLGVLIDPTYHQRKNHPRSQNSFILFRRDFEGRLRAQFPNRSYTIYEVSKIAGNYWNMQPDLVKFYFNILSKLAKERHRLAFPDYVYKPKRTGQRRRIGELSFRHMDRDTFVSRQNSRVRARRTIRDTNTCSTVQNVDGCYRADGNNMNTVSNENTVDTAVCENTNNDTSLESSSQDYVTASSMCHDTLSILLPSPESSCDNITNIDNSIIYQTIQYPTYTVPIPNLFSNTNMFETVDFFNINTHMAENNGDKRV